MIRGTTAYFKFILPYNYSQLASATIEFGQENNNGPSDSRPLPIIKTLSHCVATADKNTIAVSLSPEETARFSDLRKASVQIIATTVEGTRFGSLERKITVYPGQDSDLDGPDLPDSGFDNITVLDGGVVTVGG